MQGIWSHFFLGRRWINNQRKSNSVWYNSPQWKIIALILKITKSHLNNRICQHCGVKSSTVTPSFHYVFNNSLSCKINIPSFIGNLWWDLLLGNHLKLWNILSFVLELLCSVFWYVSRWNRNKFKNNSMARTTPLVSSRRSFCWGSARKTASEKKRGAWC